MHHSPHPTASPLTALVAVLLVAAAARGGASASPPLNRAGLVAQLRRLVQAPALQRSRTGVAVRDLEDETWVFDHNADQLYSVASNNKLATAAAALELLGPDFAFRTTVCALGTIREDGTLTGDLLVVGRGDPSISGRFHDGRPAAVLEQWAAAVADAGIKAVNGGVVVDDSYFDQQHTHPLWPKGQHAAWFHAPSGALSFNDNCILLTVTPGPKQGAPTVASVEPPTAYVRLLNRCVTSRARRGGNRVLAHRPLGTNDIRISGQIRHQAAPFKTYVTIHDPALYTGTVFREVLAGRGIRVTGGVRRRTGSLPEAPREIITTSSLVRDAVTVACKSSQNFYAEQLLKTLGRERRGKGTFPAGATVVADFLRQAGLRGPFAYHDGSGLARANRFSPRQLAALLAYMNGRRHGGLYLRSLGEPGKPGTLARRLRTLQGRLFAKTGYISRASSLSGYIESRAGRLLAFSILVNDFRCSLGQVRAIQDAICLALADYQP